MARQENASYETSGQRKSLSIDEALRRITELETELSDLKTEISNSYAFTNPTLRFLLGDGTDESLNAELRRSGDAGSYAVSLVYNDGSGNKSFYSLIGADGSRQFPPLSHASSESTYGLGTTASYGHVKTVNGLTQSSHSNGLALSAYQGYVLNSKLGSIQILSIVSLNCTQTTFVSDGSTWDSVTGTISSVSGASGYYYIPISCNFGFVTSVSVSGTTVTCKALNASGGSHSCTIVGLVIAYKTI